MGKDNPIGLGRRLEICLMHTIQPRRSLRRLEGSLALAQQAADKARRDMDAMSAIEVREGSCVSGPYQENSNQPWARTPPRSSLTWTLVSPSISITLTPSIPSGPAPRVPVPGPDHQAQRGGGQAEGSCQGCRGGIRGQGRAGAGLGISHDHHALTPSSTQAEVFDSCSTHHFINDSTALK